MRAREWLVPGVAIAVVSAALSVGGSWAVNTYRLGKTEEGITEVKALIEKSNGATNQRIDKLWERLDQMTKEGAELIRLQEQNKSLAAAVEQLRGELRDIDGKGDARYDSLNTRLSRQGF